MKNLDFMLAKQPMVLFQANILFLLTSKTNMKFFIGPNGVIGQVAEK